MVTGEITYKAVKPSRREGRMIGHTCGFCRVLFCCTRTMVRAWHPAFPAPSLIGANEFLAKLGAMRGEDAELCLFRAVRGDAARLILRHSGAHQVRTRNLEIPGSMLRIAPEMTA